MKLFINGNKLDDAFMHSTRGHKNKDFFSDSMEWMPNVYNKIGRAHV